MLNDKLKNTTCILVVCLKCEEVGIKLHYLENQLVLITSFILCIRCMWLESKG